MVKVGGVDMAHGLVQWAGAVGWCSGVVQWAGAVGWCSSGLVQWAGTASRDRAEASRPGARAQRAEAKFCECVCG